MDFYVLAIALAAFTQALTIMACVVYFTGRYYVSVFQESPLPVGHAITVLALIVVMFILAIPVYLTIYKFMYTINMGGYSLWW